jgi:hypothetical protein
MVTMDGANDYGTVTPPNNSDMPYVTVAAWVMKADVTHCWDMIVTHEAVPGNWATKPTGWDLRFNACGGAPHFAAAINNVWIDQTVYAPTLTMTNSTWAYVVGTYDGSTITTWLNGEPSKCYSTTGTITDDTSAILIGKRSDGNLYAGNIAYVALYNRGLTCAEVQQNCNAQKGRFSGVSCSSSCACP